jgi:hypothetical protein
MITWCKSWGVIFKYIEDIIGDDGKTAAASLLEKMPASVHCPEWLPFEGNGFDNTLDSHLAYLL